MMGLGSVMVIVATIGDYSVCKGKRKVLGLFAVLLAALVVAELAVGGMVYLQREEIGKFLVEFYTKVIERYKKDKGSIDINVTQTLKFIHTQLKCCGVNKSHKTELKDICSEQTQEICTEYIKNFFNSKMLTVLGIFGTGAVLIAALVCTIILLKRLKRENAMISKCLSLIV
ncbi:CD9 antigen-like [Mugil cephalus]|uniref:CD9 antigen-like n=1 Tax=Mugil cephalus TaxID=48193 RepID=UPI001FB859F3|nr:CD9 antigen-like [Mugil cephalus]